MKVFHKGLKIRKDFTEYAGISKQMSPFTNNDMSLRVAPHILWIRIYEQIVI